MVFLHGIQFLFILSSLLINIAVTSAFCFHSNVFNAMKTSRVGELGQYDEVTITDKQQQDQQLRQPADSPPACPSPPPPTKRRPPPPWM